MGHYFLDTLYFVRMSVTVSFLASNFKLQSKVHPDPQPKTGVWPGSNPPPRSLPPWTMKLIASREKESMKSAFYCFIFSLLPLLYDHVIIYYICNRTVFNNFHTVYTEKRFN